jgi:curved DNA-binding protein
MSMKFRDYYETLGISKDADHSAVRKAFRKLARKYHPDTAKDKSTAEEKFKELNEAYEVLGNAEKRKKYDELGQDWESKSQAGAQPNSSNYDYHFEGAGFSDFFEQMFGSGAHAGGGGYHQYSTHRAAQDSNTPMAGRDSHADILVSLDEVMKGTERKLSLRQVHQGSGESETKTSRIRIPKGINEGQYIRCAGLGDPGINGGAPGDLFLRVRLEKHPDFRVINADLYTDLPLAPWEALLGTEVSVPTIGGKVRIKVPPYTVNGTELRIKQKGLPQGDSAVMGDLYGIIQISNPTSISEKEKALWTELSEISSFDPRKL